MLTNEVWRLPRVVAVTTKSRSAIYEGIKAGTFPAPVKLGARAVGWMRSDIEAWMKSLRTNGA